MSINLEINNATQSPVADEFFQSVAEETLHEVVFGHPMSNDHNGQRTLNVSFLNGKNISVSLALVAPEEIRKINKEYRGHDEVTDVLSFAEYKNIQEVKDMVVDKPPKGESGDIFLGELILCYDYIKEYADQKGIKLEKELANVVSHGILHLLGFEHGEEMFEIQNKVSIKF